MGGSRRIRARRQRRARARRRYIWAVSCFIEKIVVLPLQTPRRYPLGVVPVAVEGRDALDQSVRQLGAELHRRENT